ncbi:MAG: hypothetical protein KF900_01070 [Bacteroidetes bacterium]|nr:hypothetical protein [Bacteroidota bacterium]
MKHAFLLFSSLALSGIISCKSQKNTETRSSASSQTVAEDTSFVYKGVTDQNCAAEIAFGSPGSGIDGQGYMRITKYIEEKKLASTSKPIGREGEVRICLPLTEVKGKEKETVINDLKNLVKQSQYTSISLR